MHIILGLLGTIVTILVLLKRLADAGISLAGLNPFYRIRKRKWQKEYDADPIFRIRDPMEATALFMVAVAKLDGDMVAEQKSRILALFEDKFGLSSRDATGLMVSSVHILKEGDAVRNKIDKILAPSLEKFDRAKAESALSMIREVAGTTGDMSDTQKRLLTALENGLAPVFSS